MTYVLEYKRDGSGFYEIGTAGENLGARKLVYRDTNGDWKLADADAASTMPSLGITLGEITSGKQGRILTSGYVGDATWSLAVGYPIYASSTAGEITQVTPVTGRWQIVGYAKESDLMYLYPWESVYASSMYEVPEMDWYVSGSGSNGNDGKTPDSAFLTITYAISQATAGDSINILAGTYAEDVNINKNSLRLFFNQGAIINAQAGPGITMSANYCVVCCPCGVLRINPIANGTGVYVSGIWNYVESVKIPANSSGDLGFDINGGSCTLTNCKTGEELIAAYKIRASGATLIGCITGGTAGNTSIGYWLTNNCDRARLQECSSQGHETAAIQVDAGCTNAEAVRFVSGGGDGPVLDPDNVLAGAKYIQRDNEIFKVITFAGAPTTYNIFKIIGNCRIYDLYGHVDTIIPNTSSSIHLSLYSTGGEVNITNNVGAPDIDTLPVDSMLMRKGDSTEALEMCSSATPCIVEFGSKDPNVAFDCIADADQDTYIRLNLTAALASGAIHWHCIYDPLEDNAYVIPA